MFSIGIVKTFPVASQDSAAGGDVGKTNITGPDISVTASAVSQLSSSATSSSVRAVFDRASSSPPSVRLRFLTFLSPLNDSGFTMLAVLVRW